MANRRKHQTRRAQARHRKHKLDNETYVHLLRTGAVAVGVGAAVVAGTGIAAATPAADGSSSASAADNSPSSKSGSGTDSSGSHNTSHDTSDTSRKPGNKGDKEDSTQSGAGSKSSSSDSQDAESHHDKTDTTKSRRDDSRSDAADSRSSDGGSATEGPGDSPRAPADVQPTPPVAGVPIAPKDGRRNTATPPVLTFTAPSDPLDIQQARASKRTPTTNQPVSTDPQPTAAPTWVPTPLAQTSIAAVSTLAAPASPPRTTPLTPLQQVLQQLVFEIVRRAKYTFCNEVPTALATPTIIPQDPLTGVITGNLNVVDADDAHLTYTVTTAPTAGTVSVAADGSFTYTPDTATAATGGSDGFTVTIDDAPGNPSHIHGLAGLFGLYKPPTARVAITVVPVRPPLSVVTTGSPDPITGATTYRIVAANPAVQFSTKITTDPLHGGLTTNSDGSYTYTPDAGFAHRVAAGGPNTDSFIITATTTAGSVTPYQVTVTVAPQNIDPVIEPLAAEPDPETGAITYTFSRTDADGDPISYTVTTEPGHGTLTAVTNNASTALARVALFSAEGTEADAADVAYIYTPDPTYAHAAAAGGPASDQFTITANDAHGGITHKTIQVTIDGQNSAPYFTGVDRQAPAPGTGAITVAVDATDPDNDTLTYRIADQASHGIVVANPDGTYTYTPTKPYAHIFVGGGLKTDSFSIRVDDGHGSFVTEPITVTVPFINAEPVSTAVPTIGTPDPTTGSVRITLHVTDPDGDTLSYVPVTPAKGRLVANLDGTFTYTPTAAAQTSSLAANASLADKFDTITINASDGYTTTPITATVPIVPASGTALVDHSLVATVGVGVAPQSVAVGPGGNLAYIGRGDGHIVVVDVDPTSSSYLSTIADIDTGKNTTYFTEIAVSADGNRVYAVGSVPIGYNRTGTVAVIDTNPNSATPNTLLTTIAVGLGASDIALTPDGNQAFVLNEADSSISVIDLNTNHVQDTVVIQLGNGSMAGSDIAITPDGTLAYFTIAALDAAYALEISPYSSGFVSHSVAPTVAIVADNPTGITISADGTRAYVSHPGNVVSVIDIVPGHYNNPFQKQQFVTRIQAGGFATPVGINHSGIDYQIAITPDDTRAYVIHPDGTIAAIDIDPTTPTGGPNTNYNTVISSFRVDGTPVNTPLAITFDPNSTRAYIVNTDNTLSIYSIAPVTPPLEITVVDGAPGPADEAAI